MDNLLTEIKDIIIREYEPHDGWNIDLLEVSGEILAKIREAGWVSPEELKKTEATYTGIIKQTLVDSYAREDKAVKAESGIL